MLASEIGATYTTHLPSMPLMQHLQPNTKASRKGNYYVCNFVRHDTYEHAFTSFSNMLIWMVTIALGIQHYRISNKGVGE